VERLRRFLVSRKSLAGFALAGAGLALYFLGVLTGPLWLTIVVGLYFLGALLMPGKRAVDPRLHAAADAKTIREGLDELVRRVQFKVAPDILAKVDSIRKSILVTLDDDDRGVADPTVYLIRQTALDYLPSALAAYLALPRIYAERRPTMRGRTPHDVLLEQLALMDSKMHEAADAKLAHDSERLLENGRFIADRFGTSSLRIDPGVSVAEPVAEAVPAVAEPVAEPVAESATEAIERERVR
jgi:hypothetical protein